MSDAYKKAGVDLEAGYESVERIKKHVKRTNRSGVFGAIGSFGGNFDLSVLKMKNPVLVSGTDGVGTKLMLAFEADEHSTIGIDVVAMCVNDIVTSGAEPLFFLDYLAVGKNEPAKIEQIVKGVADGCVDAGCALVGGETAEMPDMYEAGHYDIAGFAVGAVEKSKMINKENVNEGDVLIGITSSGVHSNGFSLVRKILDKKRNENADFNPKCYVSEIGGHLLKTLLEPTKIYVKSVLDVLKKIEVKSISHITGGGFYENIPRALQDNQGVKVYEGQWPILPIFEYLEKEGEIPHDEMYQVFNMGIGMVLIVDPKDVDKTLKILKKSGEEAYKIGEVTNTGKVDIVRN